MENKKASDEFYAHPQIYLVARDGCLSKRDPGCCQFDGLHSANCVISILGFARIIGGAKQANLFHKVKNNRSGKEHTKLLLLGMSLLRYFEGPGSSSIRGFYQMHDLHPKVQKFLELDAELGVSDRIGKGEWKLHDVGLHSALDVLADFVEKYKIFLKSGRCKNLCKNFKKSSSEAKAEIRKFLEGVLRPSRKITAISIDLYYQRKKTCAYKDGMMLELSEARSLLNKLLVFANKSIKGLVSYIWKLEYAPGGGCRYKLIVFLDESAEIAVGDVFTMIGNKWKELPVGGQTVIDVCFGLGAPDKVCQSLDVSNPEGLKNFKKRLLYFMTAADEFAKISSKNGFKSFSKGGIS